MINKTISSLFNFAKQEKAERIVISESLNGPSCRCHLPGGEEAVFNLPKKLENSLANNLRDLLKIAPGELTSSKYCKIRDKNNNFNFHLSILPDKLGEKIIIKIIHENQEILNLNQLGLQRRDLEIIKRNIASPGGLIVISSPEKQGRSSTIKALIDAINQEHKNIYFLDHNNLETHGVNLLENNSQNWDKIMKHDSDIIALEIENEDQESLKRAIFAASTGRLVIITIESINSLEAMHKLLSSGLPLKLILDSLKMISSQELIKLKRIKTKKKESRTQIGIFEILTLNQEIKNWIISNEKSLTNAKFWEDFFQLAIKNGYRPAIFDKKQKTKDGII